MRSVHLLLLGLGCASSSLEERDCSFNDQPATYTDPAANGMTAEAVQAAVVGTNVFDATPISDRGEGAALAAHGPFTLQVSESSEDPTIRKFDHDKCTVDSGDSVVLVPVQMRVVSDDLALDVSGPMLVEGDARLAFIEDERKLSGNLPSWVVAAADAQIQDQCTDAGLTGSYEVYATLSGAVEAPALAISIRITGDCNSLGMLADVQLQPVP
jgi:hypothetical protein